VADEIFCGEHVYCFNCRCLHVDFDSWLRSNLYIKYTCERCDHILRMEPRAVDPKRRASAASGCYRDKIGAEE
jgi:hypothetical protein